MTTHLRRTSGLNYKSPSCQRPQNAHSHSTRAAGSSQLVPFPLLRVPPPRTMPSFMHRFKHSQNLDINDMPSLVHSPSTISPTSQPSISVSLQPPLLPSYTSARDAPPPRVQFRTSPECHGPSLLAGRQRLIQISVLPAAFGDALALSLSWTWPAPTRPSHLPSCTCPRCSPAY